jgi:hypothetical protein
MAKSATVALGGAQFQPERLPVSLTAAATAGRTRRSETAKPTKPTVSGRTITLAAE